MTPTQQGPGHSPDGPALPHRRTALIAVGVVLACLLGLAAWVTLGDAPTAPQRSSGARAALRSPQAGPPSSGTGSPATGPAPEATRVRVAGSPGPGGHLDEVDWAKVNYPLTCVDTGELVQGVWLGDVLGDPAAEAVVAVRCDAGAGSPPSALYVYDGRPGDLRVLGTLVRPTEDVLLTGAGIRRRTVSARGTTYSSESVPRCCPDKRFTSAWRWADGHFERVGPPG